MPSPAAKPYVFADTLYADMRARYLHPRLDQGEDANFRGCNQCDRLGHDETMHPRLRSDPIHHVPVHGTCDRLGNIGRDAVAIHRKILRSLLGQMPRPSKLRLEVIENRPAYIV